jgi:hypothetical protein
MRMVRGLGVCALAALLGACAKGALEEDDVASTSSSGSAGGPSAGGGTANGGSAPGGAGGSTSSGGGQGGAASSTSSSGGAGGDCGDNTCDGGETCMTCEADCGPCPPVCGDQICDVSESCVTCAMDCPGAADCDGNPANGCECSTLGCCAGACQNQHVNGLGQFFYDCVPLGTYDTTQGTKAATAWPTVGMIFAANCNGPGQNEAICKQGVASCACWGYTGSNQGHVHLSATMTCSCAAVNDPSWN